MALGPINYQMQVATPFESVLQGMTAGAQMANIEAARMQREAQAAAQQQAVQQQQALDQAYAALRANPNPQFDDYERVALMLPKDRADVVFKAFESRSKKEQQETLNFSGNLLAVAKTGNRDMVVSMLNEHAQGLRNAGRAAEAKTWEDSARLAELAGPEDVDRIVGISVAKLPGGKDLIENVNKVEQQRREAKLFGPQLTQARAAADQAVANAVKAGVDAQYAPALAVAGLGKAQAEAIKAASDAKFADQLNQAGLTERNWNIRAAQNRITVETARLGLDRDKTTADIALTLARVGEIANSLPDQAKKDINTAAVASGTAKQQAVQFNSLADKLAAEGGGFGVFSSATDYLKKATGNQGYMQELRQEFTRLRNSAAVQSLPPGPATDRDIALVLEGFPPANADSRTMAGFLRGMAKLQDINSAVENARVDWLTNNRGSLARARSGFQAGEFTANPGETFVDLTARISQDISNRYAAGDGGAPRQPAPAIPGAPVQPGQVAPAGRGPRPASPASPYGGLSNDEILRRLAMPPGSR
jgi:hypothetical protein